MEMDASFEARRTNLANMKSFFGGKACTREACAIRSLVPEAPSAAPSKPSKSPALQKRSGSSTAASKSTRPAKPAPAAKRQRGRSYADFSALDDDSPEPSPPSTRLPTAGERALAAVQAVERMRQQKAGAKPRPAPSPLPPRPNGVRQCAAVPPAAHSGRLGSRPAPSPPPRSAKVVQPRSKFGAGARGSALPPQEMMNGLTDRQKADLVNRRLQASSLNRQKASLGARSQQQRPASLPSNSGSRAPHMAARLGSAGGQLPRIKRAREPEFNDVYDSDFVESDDDGGEDWRSQLRSLTGYDPRKFNPADDNDRGMEASAREIEAEEQRSKRMGAREDRAEEAREAQRAALKAAQKEKARRAKKGAAAFMDD